MAAFDEGQAVLQGLMDSGAFDELRKLLLDQLRNDEGLKQHCLELLEGSKTLEGVDWQSTRSKRTLDDLKKEIEERLIGRASSTLWGLMDEPGTSQLIDTRVHEALCATYEARHQQLQGQGHHEAEHHAVPTLGAPHAAQAPQQIPPSALGAQAAMVAAMEHHHQQLYHQHHHPQP